MAALLEGSSYGLSSLNPTNSSLSVFHVKLTDSAIKATEECKTVKNSNLRSPTIQFDGEAGEICIPVESCTEFPDGVRRFSFKLSAISGDSNGRFDCVQQVYSQKELRSIGSMSQRVTIQATDDVYQNTKQKISIADKESKKQCAKEIKSAASVYKKKSSTYRHPTNLHHSSSSNLVMMNQPLEERLVHMLAIKPMDKQSIIDQLMIEGIHDKDKHNSTIFAVLQKIAQFIPAQNKYTLKKTYYSRVRSEWVGFSNHERELIRRRFPSDQTSTGSSPAMSVSPSGSPESRQSPGPALKRPLSPSSVNGRAYFSMPKRPRVEQDDMTSGPGRPSYKASQKAMGVGPGNSSKMAAVGSAGRQKNGTPLVGQSKAYQEAKASIEKAKQQKGNDEDFTKQFTVVQSAQQRDSYKKAFDSDYAEYKEVYQAVACINKVFDDLKEILNSAEKGSRRFKNIKEKICKEYEKVKAEGLYKKKKERYDYLHQRLGHIKHLVGRFDEQHPSSLI